MARLNSSFVRVEERPAHARSFTSMLFPLLNESRAIMNSRRADSTARGTSIGCIHIARAIRSEVQLRRNRMRRELFDNKENAMKICFSSLEQHSLSQLNLLILLSARTASSIGFVDGEFMKGSAFDGADAWVQGRR